MARAKSSPREVFGVVLGLDHFRAGRSYKLADVNLQAFAQRRQIFQVSLFEVLIEVRFGWKLNQVRSS